MVFNGILTKECGEQIVDFFLWIASGKRLHQLLEDHHLKKFGKSTNWAIFQFAMWKITEGKS